MLDFDTLIMRDGKFLVKDPETGERVEVEERFPADQWDAGAFEFAGIRGYEPMTAKELATEEEQDEAFGDDDNIVEEKFDGVRALLYVFGQKVVGADGSPSGERGYCRVFSRRVSRKTGFYSEHTDCLPHIREIDAPQLDGTILDGELFIDGKPFGDVAAVVHSKWQNALERQKAGGFATFHAFDVLFYEGADVRGLPLVRRKQYLRMAVEALNSPHVREVEWFGCGNLLTDRGGNEVKAESFIQERAEDPVRFVRQEVGRCPALSDDLYLPSRGYMTPRAFYEFVVAEGGEGVVVKSLAGTYRHRRGWEYSKVKKYLTRDMVIIGFREPTKEYSGGHLDTWGYWVRNSDGARMHGCYEGDPDYEPVTKDYFHRQVGNMVLGVYVPVEVYESMPEGKRGRVVDPWENASLPVLQGRVLMEACECGGYSDAERKEFTFRRDLLAGCVAEVKANEVFRDSGRLRHPRYIRMRYDKSAEECLWEDHVGGDGRTFEDARYC